MLRGIAVGIAGDLRIAVIRSVAVRGALIGRSCGRRAGGTRRLSPSVVNISVTRIIRGTFHRTSVIPGANRGCGTAERRAGCPEQHTVADVAGISSCYPAATNPIIVIVMPEMLHVHNVLQKLRYHLHLVRMIRVISDGVMMLAAGRRRTAIARRRKFFACHTASGTANDIRYRVSALISAPTASRTILSNRLELHTHVQALFEATGRTLLPRGHSDRTACASKAHIVLTILDGAFEKSFARFAREDAVVEAAYLVAANRTGTIYQLLPGGDARRRRRYSTVFLILDDGMTIW